MAHYRMKQLQFLPVAGLHHLPHREVFGPLPHPTKGHAKEQFSSDRKHRNFSTLFEVDPSPQVIKVCLPDLHIVGGLNEASAESFLKGH